MELTIQKQRLNDALTLVETNDLKAAYRRLKSLLDDFPRFFPGWMELGYLSRRMGDHQQSLTAFKTATSLAVNHPLASVEVAISLRELGQLSQALDTLTALISRQPQNVAALFNLGLLYKKQQLKEKAMIAFDQALSVDPEHFACDFQRAITQKELNRLSQARETLTRLLEKQPKNSQLHFQLGLVSRRQADRKQAVACFDRAATLAEQPALVVNARLQSAIDLRELGDLAASEAKLMAVLSQQPHHIAARQNLGLLYQRQRKLEAAIDCYQTVIADAPQRVSAYLQLSAIWRSQGRYPQAQQQLEEALSACGNHLNVLLDLAVLAIEQQDLTRALAYCDRAHDAHPDRLEAPLQKAETLRLFNYLDQAQAQLETLLATFPDTPEILLKLAHLARQQGHRQQALVRFQQAQQCAVNPTQAMMAQLFVVEELRSLGQLEAAVDTVRSLCAQHPENIRAQMVLGSVLQQQLDLKAAEAVYRSIIASAPHEIAAHLELARVLSETHRVMDAGVLLEDLYEAGHRDLPIMMQLGHLTRAEEDWQAARFWYQLAKDHHPYKPQVYGTLADVLYFQGEIEAAMTLLAEACDRWPDAPELPLRLAVLNLRLGYPTECLRLLDAAHQRFPSHPAITTHLARLHLNLGQFDRALSILNALSSDQTVVLKQISLIKGDIALAKFQIEDAIHHFSTCLSLTPATLFERKRMALALMLNSEIEPAHAQLVLATQEQHQKKAPGAKGQPIAGHVAFLINQLRINPPLLAELQAAEADPMPDDRLLAIGSLIAREPAYFGSSTCLCKALRQQGIFSAIAHQLPSTGRELVQIPKRIVQYWDEPTPPADVLAVSASWQTHNPHYEYVRFSFESASVFLRSHYDPDVLKAFEYCEHPATQADLFRLAYLNKMGGFYADADDRCRKSLDDLVSSNAELIVYQEENACIANNFIGCVPNQGVIRTALYQAVDNLLCYNNEGPWMQTGPGLVTISLGSHLLPYLSTTDYRTWPRLWVFTQEELRHYVWWAVSLPYKQTLQNWQKAAYDGPK